MTLAVAPVPQVLVTFSGSTETDISADVRRIRITRGRSRERETMSPGRAEIDLWNFAGKYDPDNTAGPYYPNIRPNKTVRILAYVPSGGSAFTIGSSAIGGGEAFGGGYYIIPLLTGRLEGGTLSYAEGGLQPTVIWRAIDASKRLNRDRSTTGYGTAGDLTGERVTAVLDGATPTWPISERVIAPGTKTVQFAAGDQGRYDYLLQVAASEPGAFFIGANGHAIFRDADWEPIPATPALGSAPDEYAFSSIEITDDETEIYNAVTVTANALADQLEEDFSSQAEFGRADLSISSLLDSLADMSDLALTYLVAYSSPRRRVSSLRVDRTAAEWRFFLEKELMDRLSVRHRPVYGGTFQQTSAIQGISIDVNGSQDWEITYNLSPPLDIISNPNLLTDNQASMETSAAGWIADPTIVNVPGNSFYLSGVAGGSIPLVGVRCLEGRADGIPQISAGYITTPYTTVPVTVGHTYRASAWIRSYWGSIYGSMNIAWYNSGGTILSWSGGETVGLLDGYANGVTEWQQGTVEGIAPAGAAYARLQVFISELGVPYGGSAEYVSNRPHYIDAAELRDTLVISPTTVYPATIARAAVLPAPTIATTPQNRTVSVSTIARAAALPAPTVTGSAPFVPTSISGLEAWYDFSDVSTLWQDFAGSTQITTDGQTIGNVTDKSGGGVTLVQGISTFSEPTYKTAQINGKSVARFDGSDDFLYMDISIGADPDRTMFVIARKVTSVTSATDILFGYGSNSRLATDSTFGTGYLWYTDEGAAAISLGGTPTNANVIGLRLTSASSMKGWVNGGSGTSFDPHDEITDAEYFYFGQDGVSGGTFSGDYDLGEVIIYDTALSTSNVNTVGNYLAAKWGTTWTTAT